MKPAGREVDGLDVRQSLFCAIRMDTGEVLVIVEAASETEAGDRAAYVVQLLELGPRKEVQVFRTLTCLAGVPTFLESFFRTGPLRGLLH